MSNQGNKNIHGGVVPSLHGVADLASTGRHEATDQTKEIMNRKRQ